VVEVYPYATKRLLFAPLPAAKQTAAGRAALVRALQGAGLMLPCRELSHHELDAIVAAYTVYLFAVGRAEEVGDEEEGYIIVPKADVSRL
jgi:predicted nuclease with RNAse H fold